MNAINTYLLSKHPNNSENNVYPHKFNFVTPVGPSNRIPKHWNNPTANI